MFLHLAYIDPGTGSFVAQAIIGTALGATFAVRRNIAALFNKFAGKRGGDNGHDTAKEPTSGGGKAK